MRGSVSTMTNFRPIDAYPFAHPVQAMQSIPFLLSFCPPSNFKFVDYALNNRLMPFISMQNHYNLLYREEEREMFPALQVNFL